MNLPKSLQYSHIKPKGFASSFKRWTVNPQQAYNQQWQVNEQVRFVFQTKDFIDPYQSYVEIEVEFDPNDYKSFTGYNYQSDPRYRTPNDDRPSFQLDGPATSLISELIIYSNNKEIERITEYDQIGNLLQDLNVKQQCKMLKAFEGYHYDRMPTSKKVFPGDGQGLVMDARSGSTQDTVSDNILIKGTQPFVGIKPFYGQLNNATGGPVLNVGNLVYSQTGVAANIQSMNLTNTQQMGTLIGNGLNTESIADSKALNMGIPSFSHLNNVSDSQYGIQHADSMLSGYLGYIGFSELQQQAPNIISNDAGQLVNIQEKCHQFGYNRAISVGSEFNKGVQIYPFAPVLSIQNGKFIRSEAPIGYIPKDPTVYKDQTVTKKTFIVPILSTILGTLIPHDQWKLIPGNGLGELMFEFRFNRYAFFASGHKITWYDLKNPVNGFANPSVNPIISNMSQYCHEVKWKISKIQMHFDLWDFGDIVRQQIDQVLQGEGILLNGQGFSIGPTNTIQNTQAVNNNWQITNGILSLKSIWIWFLSNQYQQYSFCRKNFKLSHNLKELQLKIGQTYVPIYPVRGNSGNLFQTAYWKDTYLEFWMELLRNQGVFFDCEKTINITPEQFVVNERPYNPQNFLHTFGSQPLFHENRCKGQAVYTIDMQSDRNDNSILSGMDTTGARPFELALRTTKDVKYDGDYNEPSTMYVFLHHDVIVNYKYGQVESVGWG